VSDWADERAREWLASHAERLSYYGHESATGAPLAESLAALLRLVREEARQKGSGWTRRVGYTA